jgi:hypothetical protein
LFIKRSRVLLIFFIAVSKLSTLESIATPFSVKAKRQTDECLRFEG